jgi:hypothetical protein
MGWLRSWFGGREITPWQLGDELWCVGERWTVTAVLVERSGRREWPTLRLERGAEATWITIDADKVIRYEPLADVQVNNGQASWNGRTYTRTDGGSYIVGSIAGKVKAAVGDRAEYETLTSADDAERWISVERWDGGAIEVSVARSWSIDRVVHAPRPGGG